MSTFNLQSTIPTNGVTADGYYDPVVNIVNDSYNSPTGQSDAPYNKTLIGDASSNIVGTSTNPYLPAILPVYIPTLYENVYDIQSNLKNVIGESAIDDRTYPTSYAVKNYVASQLAGFEDLSGNSPYISTTVTTSILEINNTNNPPYPFQSPDVITNGTVTMSNYYYTMSPIDLTRNGAEKIVINNVDLRTTTSSGATTGNQMIINSGANAFFAVLGKNYTNYQFASQGDMIDMIQFISSTGNQVFIVKTYGGIFFN